MEPSYKNVQLGDNMDKAIEVAEERDYPVVIVGFDALARNGLVSGYNSAVINTNHKFMNKVQVNGLIFEFYHLWDNENYLTEISPNLYLPTAERAIIDCMVWQKENMDEGFLIEALQTYQYNGHKVEDLYECADHYLVPHEVVDYWWKEAEEEDDMSMG